MPIVGMICQDGTLLKTEDALKEAIKNGHVDGYELSIVTTMLAPGNHSDRPSASVIAGGAWRRSVLEHVLDYYVVPDDQTAMLRGTIMHSGFERLKYPRGVRIEKERRLVAHLPGADKDKTISGQLDVFYVDSGRLVDHKTTKSPPSIIREEHVYQLAVYVWLARWSGYTVKDAGINYVGWSGIQYVDSVEWDKRIIRAIDHPLLSDETVFVQWVSYGYNVLSAGYCASKRGRHLVPSMRDCNTMWCASCPLKWACDRIAAEGEEIDPSEFKQE